MASLTLTFRYWCWRASVKGAIMPFPSIDEERMGWANGFVNALCLLQCFENNSVPLIPKRSLLGKGKLRGFS